MNRLRILPASPDEINAFYGPYADKVIEADAAVVGNLIVGMGAFARKADRLWVTLNLTDEARPHGVRIVLALWRKLQGVDGVIYTQCEDESAERLLRLLGFQETGETIRMRKVMRRG